MSIAANRSAVGIEVTRIDPGSEAVLTKEALGFVADLAARFTPAVDRILNARRERQERFDSLDRPRFLPETQWIRDSDWTVAPLPEALLDRRVEITGPVDRKMVINGLNSGASVFMADLEDANSPTWDNVIQGHINLRDAVAGTIDYVQPGTHKVYSLKRETAMLMVRPRGWHLEEKHLRLDGRAVPAALFDFGLFFFHNARALAAAGRGPYFYLPKLESHLEARLWNDVFLHAQELLSIPRGSIKATVLIETLPAAFEMDEILYELREHSAGLNCGRWDYIFSTIKTLQADPSWLLPDRGQVTMEQPFLRAYTRLLVETCHRRAVHAMGGMAEQIPIRDDDAANQFALEKVRADKLREVRDGHDGTWVAHPGLVAVAREVFDAHMPGPNQIQKRPPDVRREDLLLPPAGTRTEAGLRRNVRIGIQYLEAWLRGFGCVPLENLMEDAATAEISRTQVWQWIHHHARLDDGEVVTVGYLNCILDEELGAIRGAVGRERFEGGRFREAAELFHRLSTSPTLEDFLTVPAYETLVSLEEALGAPRANKE